MKILLLNGPNLNMLGMREPEKYGNASMQDIVSELTVYAEEKGVALSHFQSNCEGKLIDTIHAARQQYQRIIINPGALGHTSIALRDALLSCEVPFTEVHLTNIHAREPFRHHTYLSDVATGVIAGFGAAGYRMALDAAVASP
ncbi:MAG: type II 3-dehydroquinate dehydratase [Alteromonadaceae bacterium]|nr:type II 3-dehydroquinate dehydratase [Alteromonadaceae bacterium]